MPPSRNCDRNGKDLSGRSYPEIVQGVILFVLRVTLIMPSAYHSMEKEDWQVDNGSIGKSESITFLSLAKYRIRQLPGNPGPSDFTFPKSGNGQGNGCPIVWLRREPSIHLWVQRMTVCVTVGMGGARVGGKGVMTPKSVRSRHLRCQASHQ